MEDINDKTVHNFIYLTVTWFPEVKVIQVSGVPGERHPNVRGLVVVVLPFRRENV